MIHVCTFPVPRPTTLSASLHHLAPPTTDCPPSLCAFLWFFAENQEDRGEEQRQRGSPGPGEGGIPSRRFRKRHEGAGQRDDSGWARKIGLNQSSPDNGSSSHLAYSVQSSEVTLGNPVVVFWGQPCCRRGHMESPGSLHRCLTGNPHVTCLAQHPTHVS